MKCLYCDCDLQHGKTVLTFQMGDEKIIVVKDVPALICEKCGEESIDITISRNVEQLVKKAINDGITIGFIKYNIAA